MRIGGKLCETGELVSLSIVDGRISEFAPGIDQTTIGGADVWLAPGFIDLQVNGYGGHDFNLGAWGSPEEVTSDLGAIFEKAAGAGTAMLCPTITTNSREAITAALKALDAALSANASLESAVPGIHLEGPYIGSEDGPRGAHPLEHVRDPDWDEFQSLQDAAGGRIRLVTLAPERAGALAFIEKLSAANVLVALGHTGASPETIRDAIRAGARMSTHLGNGSHAQIQRHPNYIWEQLASDDLYASIIADGHHLPASVLKSFVRVKGADRLALVSDAVSLGGLPPGCYSGGVREVLASGKVVMAGTPYLSGAGHLLDTCVANAVRLTDLTLAQAVRCATEIPARLLGMERKGALRKGWDADLTLFRFHEEGPLEIVATLRRGDIVYRR
ncbi:MAG: N-acetylglucosamine-6-phosphate deacetylase [Actinomycetota bacterium]